MKALHVLIVVLLSAMATSATSAHEFWLESSAAPSRAGAVALRLFVGDGFPGEAYPRNPRHIVRFELLGPHERAAIKGRRGDDPAGTVEPSDPGLQIAIYRSHASYTELPSDLFRAYLEDEGLESIVALRDRSGRGDEPGRELFSRCAKNLFHVAGALRSGHDRLVGLELELVPENDPIGLRSGEVLVVRALLDGRPHAGMLLRAFRRGAAGPVSKTRTDAEGRARIVLDQPGDWMISGVHMRESRGNRADWESVWSSLTFRSDPL